MRRIMTVFDGLVRWLIILFASLVTLISLVWTVKVDYNEKIFTYDHSHWWLTLLLAVSLLLVVHFTPLLAWLKRYDHRRLAFATGVITWIMGVIWAFSADVGVIWDSLDLWIAATDPNAPQWDSAGYMERYPYQASMIIALKACRWLAGADHALLLFQLGNAVCVGVSSWLVVLLVHAWSENDRATGLAAVMQIMFLPPILYVTFVYGNQFALMCMLAAFLCQSYGFQSKRVRWNILAILLILLAVIAKRTFLLAAITLAIVWLLEALRNRAWKPLIPAILSLACCLLIPTSLDSMILRHYDANPNNGLPKTTWIVMGLSAGHKEHPPFTALGMFDGHPFDLPADQYSPEKQAADDRKLLHKQLKEDIQHPHQFINYLTHKTIYEWADPTHGSILASNWERGTTPPLSTRAKTRIANSMYDGKLHTVTVTVMDVIQLLTLFGFLLAFTFSSINIRDRGLALFALGGFLLYLIWEAKSQYTLPMIQAMLPYAAIGLTAILDGLKTLGTRVDEAGQRVLDEMGLF